MSFYSVVLFAHIVGTLALFMTFAFEWTGLLQMWRATTLAQARPWVRFSSIIRPLGIATMLVIVVAGMYLARRMEAWHDGWVWAALAGVFSMAGIGFVLTERRMKEIRKACADESTKLTDALALRLRDPILSLSLCLRTAIALGIVFLMTTKPNLGGALLTLGLAAIAGVLPTSFRRGQYQLRKASAGDV